MQALHLQPVSYIRHMIRHQNSDSRRFRRKNDAHTHDSHMQTHTRITALSYYNANIYYA